MCICSGQGSFVWAITEVLRMVELGWVPKPRGWCESKLGQHLNIWSKISYFQLFLLPHGYMEQVCVWALGLSTHYPHAAGSPCLSVASRSLLQFTGLIFMWQSQSPSGSFQTFFLGHWGAFLSHLHSTKGCPQNVALASISCACSLVPCLLPSLWATH